MKKVSTLLLATLILSSCGTSPKKDLFMLQQKFPNANLIYMVNMEHYIVEDSAKNIYDVNVGYMGGINYQIKLK